MDAKYKIFGQRLTTAMGRLSMTQLDLAQAMGTGRNTVNKWCRGHTQPQPQRLARLSHMLGVSESWLTGADSERQPATTPSAQLDLRCLQDTLTIMGEVARRHRDWFANPRASAVAVRIIYERLAAGEPIESVREATALESESLTQATF